MAILLEEFSADWNLDMLTRTSPSISFPYVSYKNIQSSYLPERFPIMTILVFLQMVPISRANDSLCSLPVVPDTRMLSMVLRIVPLSRAPAVLYTVCR